ncbi:hypothetical protein POTOM_012157 [Populus tomentosa]|uniref:Generative cell specific-1/HAP2 domain-containing protein n=1 Tax=Populus tomentosa TaxID=118781 RepID=A0A8X8A4D7_POPTO|nr:hypothetical protein POTOM_012157 [Populus tomentosa]
MSSPIGYIAMADQNRIIQKQLPPFGVEGRFERINQHPNAGTPSFSIGFTEILNTNLLIELTTDDIGYVYQRSSEKLSSVTIPTFETLTQFGVATVSAKIIAIMMIVSSLQFDCSRGVALMELSEVTMRSFKIYPATDKAARCVCAAILKDSSFNETDPAECQLFTTATILENGPQVWGQFRSPFAFPMFAPFRPPKISINGFFESIEDIWNRIWGRFSRLHHRKSLQKGLFDPFMTGGKIIFGMMSRESEIHGDTKKMKMEIVSWDQDSNIMLVSEEAFIKSTGTGIQEGMQITIIIFTMSTRTRVSTGEVRNQMSRSKSIWMDRRIPILEDIIDTERKEIVEGLFK